MNSYYEIYRIILEMKLGMTESTLKAKKKLKSALCSGHDVKTHNG